MNSNDELPSATALPICDGAAADNTSRPSAMLINVNDQTLEQLQHDISQVSLAHTQQPDVREKQSCASAAGEDLPNPVNQATVMSEKDAMLDRIANSDAHFRHQQRGDPDLTYDEKFNIATELLDKPSVFLSRFGRYLTEQDLVYFIPFKDDYVVDFHLKEINQRLNDRKNQTKIRNRRYEAMKEMLSKGDYFSDDEMKRRDPLLYEQMVGRFLTDDDIAAEIDKTDLSFSNILLKHIQVQHNETLYQYQKSVEEGQMEEEEDEDEEEEEEEMEEAEYPEPGSDGRVDLPTAERSLLRNEFMRTMQLRFLNGEDAEFSYRDVDDNVEFDSVDIRTRDEEESYFDGDDPDTAESLDSSSAPEGCSKTEVVDADIDCDALGTDETEADKT